MDGAYKAFIKVHGPDVVEDFARKHREDCQLRLAKITNGVHPDFQNGKRKRRKVIPDDFGEGNRLDN